MRFGISEISWMLPKILRIRRELVLSPLVVLRRASIALVAICFPALRGTHASARSANCCPAWAGTCHGALVPLLLPNAYDPCAVRTLSRGGREKPRAHVTVRRSRLCVDGADIVICERDARGRAQRILAVVRG